MWPDPAVMQTAVTSTFIKYSARLGKAPRFPIHFAWLLHDCAHARIHTDTLSHRRPRTQHGVLSKMSAPSLFERCFSALLMVQKRNSSRQKHLFEMQRRIKSRIRSNAAQLETFFFFFLHILLSVQNLRPWEIQTADLYISLRSFPTGFVPS